jgi:hypothetical protein
MSTAERCLYSGSRSWARKRPSSMTLRVSARGPPVAEAAREEEEVARPPAAEEGASSHGGRTAEAEAGRSITLADEKEVEEAAPAGSRIEAPPAPPTAFFRAGAPAPLCWARSPTVGIGLRSKA